MFNQPMQYCQKKFNLIQYLLICRNELSKKASIYLAKVKLKCSLKQCLVGWCRIKLLYLNFKQIIVQSQKKKCDSFICVEIDNAETNEATFFHMASGFNVKLYYVETSIKK